MDRLRMAITQPRLEEPAHEAQRSQRRATLWVVVLTLPVLFAVLFIALEILGLIVRVV
jgi:hypothetical protein